MKQQKVKVTIEGLGQPTQVIETEGMAAVALKNTTDEGHEVGLLICGNMSVKDLIHLHDAIKNNLLKELEETIIAYSPKSDLANLIKAFLGGK